MKDINDFRRDRKAAADAMETAAAKIAELEGVEGDVDQDAVIAAQADFDTSKAAFEAADAFVKRLEAVEAAQATAATSEVTQPALTPTASGAVPGTFENPEDRNADIGIMIVSLMNKNGDVAKACAMLDTEGHSGISAALSGATEAAGGVTIPRPSSQTIIDLLTPNVLVRNMGVDIHDMPAGELRNAKADQPVTVQYSGENADIRESEPTFGKVDEKFKKQTALVPIGNSLLRHSSMSVGRFVRDQMITYMAVHQDINFIRSNGAGDSPRGILDWCPAAHNLGTIANTALLVESSLRRLKSMVEDADVPLTRPGWMMRASTKNFLANLRDPDSGVKIFPSIEINGTLMGYPIGTSSQIPDNLGGGTDETEVAFVDFAHIMIGQTLDITIATSTEAAYVDVGGNTVSAFGRDLTLLRAIAEHDLAPAHDVAIAYLNGQGWSL